MKNYQKIFAAMIFCLFLSAAISAQSGDGYEITQSAISSGGGEHTGDNYSLTGTSGQPVAGTNSTGGDFGVRGGFWTPPSFGPTASMVAISGRVLHFNGRGLSGVRIILNDSTGRTRTALTSPFGYFRFDDVQAGQTYIISAVSRRYQFENQTQVVFANAEITGLTFNALP